MNSLEPDKVAHGADKAVYWANKLYLMFSSVHLTPFTYLAETSLSKIKSFISTHCTTLESRKRERVPKIIKTHGLMHDSACSQTSIGSMKPRKTPRWPQGTSHMIWSLIESLKNSPSKRTQEIHLVSNPLIRLKNAFILFKIHWATWTHV